MNKLIVTTKREGKEKVRNEYKQNCVAAVVFVSGSGLPDKVDTCGDEIIKDHVYLMVIRMDKRENDIYDTCTSHLEFE